MLGLFMNDANLQRLSEKVAAREPLTQEDAEALLTEVARLQKTTDENLRRWLELFSARNVKESQLKTKLIRYRRMYNSFKSVFRNFGINEFLVAKNTLAEIEVFDDFKENE